MSASGTIINHISSNTTLKDTPPHRHPIKTYDTPKMRSASVHKKKYQDYKIDQFQEHPIHMNTYRQGRHTTHKNHHYELCPAKKCLHVLDNTGNGSMNI